MIRNLTVNNHITNYKEKDPFSPPGNSVKKNSDADIPVPLPTYPEFNIKNRPEYLKSITNTLNKTSILVKDINPSTFNQSRMANTSVSKKNFQDIPHISMNPITIKKSLSRKVLKIENVKEKPTSLITETNINNTIIPSINQNTIDIAKDISKNIGVNNSDSCTKDNIYSFSNFGLQKENLYFFS